MNILIIENSSTLSQIMEKTLDSYGYKVTLDNDNFASKVYVKNGIFEFVILNTKLSGEKSEEILSYIIKHSPNSKVLGVCNNGVGRKGKFLKSWRR